MSDHVFVLECVTAPWTDWMPRWVLNHRGVYEYQRDDGPVLVFDSVRQAEDWVRNNRPGWWIQLPPQVMAGRYL